MSGIGIESGLGVDMAAGTDAAPASGAERRDGWADGHGLHDTKRKTRTCAESQE